MVTSGARVILDPSLARRRCGFLLLGLTLSVSLPSTLLGQERPVRFDPRSGEEIDERLASFLEGSYTLWTQDTVVSQDEIVDGNLLVLEGAVRIAGTVTGSIFVVDGDLFLRPGARIAGDLVVIGGGYYSSSRATVEGDVEYQPSLPFAVLPEAGGYLIYLSEEPLPVFEFHGLYGFGVPTYQRVDALTLFWGATLRATGWDWRPDLSLDGGFSTGSSQFHGTVRQFWYPSRKIQFGWELELNNTVHNEEWIWGTLVNSLSYFFAGEDVRNYYQADRAAATIERPPGAGLSPSFTFRWEDARSLAARDYFVVFPDDSVQVNPAIDPGETVSGIFSLAHRTKRGTPGLNAAVTLEGASESIAGDFSFLLGELRARWDYPTVYGQQLKLFLEARGDLAGDLPRQRWSAFGGVGTLPTFTALELRGPRLMFGSLSYFVPLLPWAKESAMVNFVAHARGGAVWNEGESSRFESNLIFGIRVFFAEVGMAVDPATGRVVAELVLSGDRLGGIVVP